jgi:CMP-N-acetylneuraminic acid synthetase
MINTRKAIQKELEQNIKDLDYYGFSKSKSFLKPKSAIYLNELIVKEYDIINKNGTFNNKANSVFPIIEYSYPIQRSLRLVGTKTEFNDVRYESTGSQDLDKTYHDSEQFYFINYSFE